MEDLEVKLVRDPLSDLGLDVSDVGCFDIVVLGPDLRLVASALAEVTGATLGYLPEGGNAVGAHLAGFLPGRSIGGQTVASPGLNIADMFAAKLKAYVLFGAIEPKLDLASEMATAALEAAEFVVALSPYSTAAEYADVVLPIGTFAHLYHSISGLTLHRYHRLCQQLDAPTEMLWLVKAMVAEVNRVDPLYFQNIEDPLPLEQTLEYRALQELQRVRAGDFAVQLPTTWTGMDGKIADTFNEIVAANQRMAQQLEHVGLVVGREGKIRQRVKLGLAAEAHLELARYRELREAPLDGADGIAERRFGPPQPRPRGRRPRAPPHCSTTAAGRSRR